MLLARDGGDAVNPVLDLGERPVRVATLSGQHLVRRDPILERDRLGIVGRRPTRRPESQRVAGHVDGDMELGVEAARRAVETVRRLPAVLLGMSAAHACTPSTGASIGTARRSRPSDTLANSRPRTPGSSQRAKRVYMLFHLPYSARRKRHPAPPQLTSEMASRKAPIVSRYIVWI